MMQWPAPGAGLFSFQDPEFPGLFLRRVFRGGQFAGQETLEIVKVHGLELPETLHPDRGVAQPPGSSLHQMIRPRRSCRISPAAASTARCFEIAARLTGKGAATSVTAMSSSSNMPRIARRVGSARAEKMVSSVVLGRVIGFA